MIRSPIPRRRKPRRVSVLRDKKHLAYLRKQKCVVCALLHRPGRGLPQFFGEFRIIEAAHGPVNGASSKGADNEAVSLCRHHHQEQHRLGWPAFEAQYGFSREAEAAAHYAAYLAGVRE